MIELHHTGWELISATHAWLVFERFHPFSNAGKASSISFDVELFVILIVLLSILSTALLAPLRFSTELSAFSVSSALGTLLHFALLV